MTTNIELAARLLRDAAEFFRTVGEQNPALQEQMGENAAVFQEVARLIESDPDGIVPED